MRFHSVFITSRERVPRTTAAVAAVVRVRRVDRVAVAPNVHVQTAHVAFDQLVLLDARALRYTHATQGSLGQTIEPVLL